MDNFNVSNFNTDTPQKKISLPKIIFIILGVVLIAEVIYAGWSLIPKSAGTPLPVQSNSNVEQSVSRISLTAPEQSFQVGDVIPVLVSIDSGGKNISGVDLIVQYDPEFLEITNEDLEVGQALDEYPFKSVDPEQGLVSISGITSLGNDFSGAAEFAALNFRAVSPGQTVLSVNFEKGSTVASNLVEVTSAQNILEETDDLELIIE